MMNSSIKSLMLFLTIYLTGNLVVFAESNSTDQQELNKALELMQGTKLDLKELLQIEKSLQKMVTDKNKIVTDDQDKEKTLFEKNTANNGDANVEIAGKTYSLKLTKCEVNDRTSGLFNLQARQIPGTGDAKLWINGGGNSLQSTLLFSIGTFAHESDPTKFKFDGQKLEWQGNVTAKQGSVPLKLALRCGAEAQFLDQLNMPKAKTPAKQLTLKVANETYEFDAGLCSTKGHQVGNLVSVLDVTATGFFQDRPAILLLTKKHPVGQTRMFDEMRLLLGELTPEQRILPPSKLMEQLDQVVNDYLSKQQLAHQEKYNKHFWDSLPADKLSEALLESQEAMSVYLNKSEAMKYPMLNGNGVITIKGQNVFYRGKFLFTDSPDSTPLQFQDLSGKAEIRVSCDGE